MGDETDGVNSNNIAASSPPDAGFFAAAQNFTIANSHFVDIQNHYVVCDYCAGVKMSIIMITLSKSTILQFLLK